MKRAARGPRSLPRVFARYAAIALLPVVALGVVLAESIRSEANKRGVAEGRSEAVLVARTAVEPLLERHDLGTGIDRTERAGLTRLTRSVIAEGDVLRLRVRDLSGRVVFSGDGSGLGDRDDDDDAFEAAGGEVEADLTHLNSDSNDTGRVGTKSVEVYVPLTASASTRRIGVLEIYLPYAPISHDVTGGLRTLYLDLAVGLGLLYLALFAITASVSRGLRRAASVNAFLAEHDPLTDLPNRTLFHRRASTAVAAAGHSEGPAAIAIIDLDRFKDVNDTLGHQNGDRLLTELATRLAGQMRPGDTVARLGGDEFGLVLRDITEPESALRRLREVIDGEVELGGLPVSTQASVGYAMAPDDGTDVDELLQHADVAMYVAKAHHEGVARYDSSLNHYRAASLTLVSQLRRAIDDGQLLLHYQPQSTLIDGSVRVVEALVRWQHPTEGLLSPGLFLPLAEQTDEVDVPAERLIIEVTETTLLADPERAAAVLTRLAHAGVGISLDDFGQGQTSLGYLSALPLHELKIDRSFIADMLDNPAHAAIVRSMIELGHNLSLRVVGEGVETDEILARLADSDCDVAQGFLLARPMALADLSVWLPGSTASPAAA